MTHSDRTTERDVERHIDLLSAALDYADLGLPVFPCKPADKSPLTPHGFKDATTNKKRIREWWRRWPKAMIGIPTGRESGIDVLDLDLKPDEYVDGFEHVPLWKQLSPVIVRTPSGGAHAYFKSSGKLRNSTDQVAPGVDTRGDGGYVIVPPSYNRDGDYSFIKGNLEDLDRLPPFPAELFAKLGARHNGQVNADRKADPERIRAAMKVIPNPDLGWEDWNKFCMAIWAATGGSQAGLAIFDEWSQRSGKYDERRTRKKWDALTRSPPTRIGAGTIFHHANQIAPGWAAGGAPILSAKTPLESAKEFWKRRFSSDGACALVHYRGDFYEWTGTHYEQCERDGLRSLLYEFGDEAVTPGEDGYEPFNPNTSKVNQILDALAAGVQEKATANAPFWIKNDTNDADPAKLIACRNGLLNIETGELLPHTPRFFNVNCLPFDYDPDAPTYPPKWMAFLRELWPGDDDGRIARYALQEMFGLMLTPDTSFQKIFVLIGPKRSGKGTIARIMRAMLGKDNVGGPTLAGLSTQFGLQPCINKQAAIISDARLGKGTNVQAIAERLLSISGEDALTIDRKYKDAWTGQLGVRFLILSNELPQIPDAAGALASRFVILMLSESFFGREDRALTDKLLTELPGILNWALAGLKRLRKYGYFEMPQSSLAAIRQLEDLASPVHAFLRDWCDTKDPNSSASVKELYKAYQHWCEEHGMRANNSIAFGKNLRAALPQLGVAGRGKGRCYTGVQLSDEGRTQYDEARRNTRRGNQATDDE